MRIMDKSILFILPICYLLSLIPKDAFTRSIHHREYGNSHSQNDSFTEILTLIKNLRGEMENLKMESFDMRLFRHKYVLGDIHKLKLRMREREAADFYIYTSMALLFIFVLLIFSCHIFCRCKWDKHPDYI